MSLSDELQQREGVVAGREGGAGPQTLAHLLLLHTAQQRVDDAAVQAGRQVAPAGVLAALRVVAIEPDAEPLEGWLVGEGPQRDHLRALREVHVVLRERRLCLHNGRLQSLQLGLQLVGQVDAVDLEVSLEVQRESPLLLRQTLPGRRVAHHLAEQLVELRVAVELGDEGGDGLKGFLRALQEGAVCVQVAARLGSVDDTAEVVGDRVEQVQHGAGRERRRPQRPSRGEQRLHFLDLLHRLLRTRAEAFGRAITRA
eukprot:scaffold437_cov168-Ochromonas_danica.AAC.53